MELPTADTHARDRRDRRDDTSRADSSETRTQPPEAMPGQVRRPDPVSSPVMLHQDRSAHPSDRPRLGLAGPPDSIHQRERQRWADRLERAETPVSNREELRERLSRLEPGHPSSPWEADGTPKPPAPRLADLERPEPPLSDADYAAHVREVAANLEHARASGLRTDNLHALAPDHQEWTAERAKAHRSILGEAWNQAADVPCERKAIIAGGLGGAGKTTILAEHTKVDQSRYLTIDPDKFKEKLAQRGLIPEVSKLSPMEASSLGHEESSYLSRQLALRATAEGKNIIWDITMSSSVSTARRVDELRQAGYDHIQGVFVDIPIETSVARTEARHRRGCDQYLAGQGLGGRYVPAEVIRAQRDSEFGSINRNAFEKLKSAFDSWTIYDNSVDGHPAILVETSEKTAAGPRRPEERGR
jgi:predicted ABC-type ATPase